MVARKRQLNNYINGRKNKAIKQRINCTKFVVHNEGSKDNR